MSTGTLQMPRPKRNDRAVKIENEIAVQAGHVADSMGISLAEYLSGLLRTPVFRDYQKTAKKRLEQKREDE